MVSQSKILGKPLLIFVAVGSTEFPFDRLVQAVVAGIGGMEKPPRVIIQGGVSGQPRACKNIEFHRYLSPDEMNRFISRADKIVTHAGFGLLHQIEQRGRVVPLVVPRLRRYREHVDDHQLHYARYLAKRVALSLRPFIVTDDTGEASVRRYFRQPVRMLIKEHRFFPDGNREAVCNHLSAFMRKQS